MYNIQTDETLKFNSSKELLNFMQEQSENDFKEYQRQYSKQFPNFLLTKINGVVKVVKKDIQEIKVIRDIEDIDIKRMDNTFVYYESPLFDGLIKVNMEKNSNFIGSLASAKIDQDMWNKMRCDL